MNYFRIGSVCIFFGEKASEVEAAFETAQQLAHGLSSRIVLFKPCKAEGKWNNCSLVGHRNREDIVADIAASESLVERVARSVELQMLNDRFWYE